MRIKSSDIMEILSMDLCHLPASYLHAPHLILFPVTPSQSYKISL